MRNDITSNDLSDELARTLPRWVGWIPVLGKAGHQWWVERKLAARTDWQVRLFVIDVRISVSAPDEGSIDLALLVANFSKNVVEADRFELHSLSVGGYGLQRRSDMIQMTGTVPPLSAQHMHVSIDLHAPDVRRICQGISRAPNPLSTPQASVRIYANIVFLSGRERFRKHIDASMSPSSCNVASNAVEAFSESS